MAKSLCCSFGQLDILGRSGKSAEKLPTIDWPVGKSGEGHFLD